MRPSQMGCIRASEEKESDGDRDKASREGEGI